MSTFLQPRYLQSRSPIEEFPIGFQPLPIILYNTIKNKFIKNLLLKYNYHKTQYTEIYIQFFITYIMARFLVPQLAWRFVHDFALVDLKPKKIITELKNHI